MSHSIGVSWVDESIVVLTFSDPPRGNQMSWAAVDALAEQLKQCRESGARVVVLASGLEGHWLEHAWLRDLSNGLDGQEQTGSGEGWFTAPQELSHPEVVSIAAISGDSSGGGAELGWACDIRVAASHARFCQPEVNMGLTTGIGGCSRLTRLVGRTTAAEMVLTGRSISAQRLYDLGAITRLVSGADCLRTALELADDLVGKSPAAIAGLKRILARNDDASLPEELRYEQEVFQSVVVTGQARAEIERVQSEYDRGASIAKVHHYDRWRDK